MMGKLSNTEQRIKPAIFGLVLFKELRSWLKEGAGLALEKL